MRDFYRAFFKRGMLPDVIAVQDPVLLFDALYEPPEEAEIPEGLGWFYGE